MKDIGIPNFIREMTESKSDILFVSSINYEKRSLYWIRIANKVILRNQIPKQIHLYRLSLVNTGQPISILDEKTRSQEFDFTDHLDLLKYRIETDKIKVRLKHSTEELFLQDLADSNEILGDMLKNLTLTEPYQIVFDITALPRRVLLVMMETFARLIELKKADSLYILYTWPARYPVAGRSTNTGSLRVENAKVRLTPFLSDIGEIHGIMTAGRDGSIGRLFLESMPTGTKVDTYFHIKKDDYLYALDNILENSNVFSYIDNHSSSTLNYYLSISRGYDAIINRIKSVLRNWKVVCQELCKNSDGLGADAGTEMFLRWRLRTTA